MFKKHKFLALISILICLLIIFTGCSSKKDAKFDKGNSSPQYESKEPGNNDTTTDTPENQNADSAKNYGKIITSRDISMETLEFDKAVKGITNDVLSNGGYIESSQITGKGIENSTYAKRRNAYIAARIPKDKFVSVSDGVEKYGVVVNMQTESKNVTSQYIDTEARVKTLKVQEERLLDLLKKSSKIEDMIVLEKELSQVRYEIENLTGSLRNIDNLVEYSTLIIRIQEVLKETELRRNPTTLGERMKDGFISAIMIIESGIQYIIIAISFLLPFIVIALIILLAYHFIVKQIKKGKNNK